MSDNTPDPGSDPWTWWQARRLRYNLALAAAGGAAYALDIAFFAVFRHSPWRDWQGALSMTLFLGLVFLAVMGAANVCYLVGPALEAWLRPANPLRYRRSAYALGLWGSVGLPFLFPLANLSILIGQLG